MQLKRYSKVSKPSEDEEHKGDKLHKVREIWDEFISRCKVYYWPAQQVGIDEAIEKFKGRCSFIGSYDILCMLLSNRISLECLHLCW